MLENDIIFEYDEVTQFVGGIDMNIKHLSVTGVIPQN